MAFTNWSARRRRSGSQHDPKSLLQAIRLIDTIGADGKQNRAMSDTSRLNEIIEDAYSVFSQYRLTLPLHCCGCENCVPHDAQRQIVDQSPHNVELGLLQSWEDSAAAQVHVCQEQGTSGDDRWRDEVRSLLPRMMELLVQGEEPSSLGIENTFRVASLAGWQEWPADERDILVQFVETFFQVQSQRLTFAWAPIGHVLSYTTAAEDMAVALLIMGVDVERVIELWQGADDPTASVHIAEARRTLEYDKEGNHTYSSAWLKDDAASLRLGQWLVGPENDQRLEATFFATQGEDHDAKAIREIISRALG